MDIIVRKAEVRDSERIIEMLLQICEIHHSGRADLFKKNGKKYDKNELFLILKDEKRPVFVAVDENDVAVGYAFCVINSFSGLTAVNDHVSIYIDDFCVDKDCRGRGTGKIIFDKIKDYAKQIGAYNIELNVWEFNKPAIAFYESLGMETQRRRMEIIV